MAKEKEPAMAKPTTRLAISIEPDLAKRLLGRDAARIEEKIEEAVREILGTTSPEELTDKLAQDQGLAHLLRRELAIIESEAEQMYREGRFGEREIPFGSMDLDLSEFRRRSGAPSEETIQSQEAAIERRPKDLVEPNMERSENPDATDELIVGRIFLRLASDEQKDAMAQLIVKVVISSAFFFIVFPPLGGNLELLGWVLISAVFAESAASLLMHRRLYLIANRLLNDSKAKS